jgi:formamidopyrimidine-DNA glycosylase
MDSPSFVYELEYSERMHEKVFKKLYSDLGYTTVVEIDDLHLQSAGIDVIALDHRGKFLIIEEKCDRYTSLGLKGGFMFELETRTGKPGWIAKKPAHSQYEVHYAFPKDSLVYMFDFAKLKEWWTAHGSSYKPFQLEDIGLCVKVPTKDIPRTCYRLASIA